MTARVAPLSGLPFFHCNRAGVRRPAHTIGNKCVAEVWSRSNESRRRRRLGRQTVQAQLDGRAWIMGDTYTIAGIATVR